MSSLVHLLGGLDIVSREPHRPSGCYVVTSRPDQRLLLGFLRCCPLRGVTSTMEKRPVLTLWSSIWVWLSPRKGGWREHYVYNGCVGAAGPGGPTPFLKGSRQGEAVVFIFRDDIRYYYGTYAESSPISGSRIRRGESGPGIG